MNKSILRVVLVTLAAAAAIIMVALPTTMADTWRWIAPLWMYKATIITANIAAWSACLLALTLILKRSRDDAAFALALFLSLAALAYGCFSAQTFIRGIHHEWLVRATSAVQLNAVVAAAAGCLRFASLFPRAIHAGDIERLFKPRADGERLQMRDSWGAMDNRINAWMSPVRRHFQNTRLGATRTVSSARQAIALHGWLLRPRSVWVLTAYSSVAIAVVCAFGWYKVGLLFSSYAAVLALISLSYLRLSYATSDEVQRRRALWVVEGFLVTIAPAFIVELILMPLVLINVPVTELFFGAYVLALAVGAVAFVGCLAIATFYAGSFDSALVIRRTTVYSGVVAVLTGVFAIVENFVTNAIAAHTSLPANTGAMIAAVAVAVAFGPLRTWLTRVVEKLMARKRIDSPPAKEGLS